MQKVYSSIGAAAQESKMVEVAVRRAHNGKR